MLGALRARGSLSGLSKLAQTQAANGSWAEHASLFSGRTYSNVPTSPSEDKDQFVYVGPFSVAVKRVKKLSLFSLACAVGACPVIFGLDASTSMTAKTSIAATLCGFGAFTTGMLHWFTSPYIHKLVYDPKTQTIQLDTLTFLAKPKTQTVSLSDVKLADTMHPLASFSVNGSTYHVDSAHFTNKALLEKLVPQPEPIESNNNNNNSNDTNKTTISQ